MNSIEIIEKEIQQLETRAQSIADSFTQVKKNPLDLNKLMMHVMLLSQVVDNTLREKATILKRQLEVLQNEAGKKE